MKNIGVAKNYLEEDELKPLPDEELLEKYPDQSDLFHKPDFLIVRSKKN